MNLLDKINNSFKETNKKIQFTNAVQASKKQKTYSISILERDQPVNKKADTEELSRMQSRVKTEEIFPNTIEDIAGALESGNSIRTSTPFMKNNFPDFTNVPLNKNGKKPYGNDIFHFNELICVDIDNAKQENFLNGEIEEQPLHITIEDYKEYLKVFNLDYSILYPTYSHKKNNKDLHKFRVIFQNPYKIQDIFSFKKLYKALQEHVKNYFKTSDDIMDRATSSVMNVFHGTKFDVECNDVILRKDFLKTILKDKFTIKNNILRVLPSDREENAIVNEKVRIRDIDKIEDISVRAFLEANSSVFDKNVTDRYEFIMAMGKIFFDDKNLDDKQWVKLSNILKPDTDWQQLYDNTISESKWISPYYPQLVYIMKDTTEETSSNIKNNYFINRVKNFSNYKELFYNEYISNGKVIEKIMKSKKKFLLLKADTGGGKTHSVMEYILNNQKGYNVFVCPTKSTTKQTYTKWKKDFKSNIQLLHDGKAFDPEKKVIITTWDSLKKVKIKDINLLVFDEEHMTVSDHGFREEAIEEAKKFEKKAKKVLLITATPNALNLNEYDMIFNAINTQEINQEINIEIVKTKKEDYIINQFKEHINPSDSTDKLYLDKELDMYLINSYNDISNIEDNLKIDHVTITSNSVIEDNKARNVYNNIIENDILTKNNIICTSFFNVGVNIINEFDVVNLYISNINDACVIKQTIARFRKALKINVFILYNGSEKGFVYDYDFFYNRITDYNEQYVSLVKEYYDVNNMNMMFDGTVNYNEMKFKTYSRIYNTVTTYDFFKEMLEEWFENVMITEKIIKKAKVKRVAAKTKLKKALIEFFKSNKTLTKKSLDNLNVSDDVRAKLKSSTDIKQTITSMLMSSSDKDRENQYIKDMYLLDSSWFGDLCMDKFRKLKPYTEDELISTVKDDFLTSFKEIEPYEWELISEIEKRCFKIKKEYYPIVGKNYNLFIEKVYGKDLLKHIKVTDDLIRKRKLFIKKEL